MGDRAEVLTAPLIIEYPFSRTTGPVIGAFLTGLREQVIVGTKTSDGRVLVPPMEYDPTTGEAATEMVEVGPGGTVTTWAWVHHPRPKDPLDHPFAWALIRIDGAESALLHAVDAGDIAVMSTGMHVTPRWRAEREGHINDIECFVPDGDNR
jgi:uncharacterized OB-fold protein